MSIGRLGNTRFNKSLRLLQDNLEHHLGILRDGFIYDLPTRDRRSIRHNIMPVNAGLLVSVSSAVVGNRF